MPVSEEDAVSELDRLEAAMSECREVIREAHAATKDLRAAVREAKQELRVLAADEVAAHIQAGCPGSWKLGERTGEAVTAATQKVIVEFDRFGEALLGKEAYWQKASGRRSATRPDPDVLPPGIGPTMIRADPRVTAPSGLPSPRTPAVRARVSASAASR